MMLATPTSPRRRSRPPITGRGAHGARAVMARVAAACLAALLLVATLTSGRSYLFCAMAERAVDACCCEPVRVVHLHAQDGDEDAGRAAQLGMGCCHSEAYGEIARGHIGLGALDLLAAPPATALPPAPIFTAPPAPADARARVASPPLPRAAPIRAGPRTASDTCVRLQVFRC